MINGAIIRIVLRVIAGALISKGWFAPEQIGWIADDPDVLIAVNMAVGGIIWAGTEVYYYLAKKRGWAT